MQIICRSLDPFDHTMVWAASCLGFFGFLWAGEFMVNSPFNPDVHFTINDIQADSLFNPRSFRIYIKCSKMDPFRQGCYIPIGTGSSDRCPVRALTQYLHWHGSTPGPLFYYLLRIVIIFADLGQTWFMQTHRKHAGVKGLNYQWLSSTIQSILSSVGVPGCFTGHSFCIGAATSAASCGLPDHLIKTLGRSSSDAYQIFIRTPIITFTGVASQLVWQVFLFIPSPAMLFLSDRVLPPAMSPVSLTWTNG